MESVNKFSLVDTRVEKSKQRHKHYPGICCIFLFLLQAVRKNMAFRLFPFPLQRINDKKRRQDFVFTDNINEQQATLIYNLCIYNLIIDNICK